MKVDWSLLKRSMISGLSEEGQKKLDEWLDESPAHRELYRNMKAFYFDRESFRPGEERTRQFEGIYKDRLAKALRKKQSLRLFRKVGIAASWLIALGTIALVLLVQDGYREDPLIADGGKETGIQPGSPQAILVTQEGKTIKLNTGVPAVKIAGGVELKNQGNALLYNDTLLNTLDIEENQLIIPRGGEYSIVLGDGSRVWLNSASELKYPVRFAGDVRQVYLKGEAYFQVTPDRDKAFVVVTDEVEVKVYGTEFNINTRVADYVQTILVKGAVSVKAGQGEEKMLKPNQMAQFDKTTGKTEIKDVDVSNYIGWKSGSYVFEDKSIEQIMEELALWYDIEVFYRNNASRYRHFSGSLPRYREIGDMLKVIAGTSHARFEIKGKTIIVD